MKCSERVPPLGVKLLAQISNYHYRIAWAEALEEAAAPDGLAWRIDDRQQVIVRPLSIHADEWWDVRDSGAKERREAELLREACRILLLAVRPSLDRGDNALVYDSEGLAEARSLAAEALGDPPTSAEVFIEFARGSGLETDPKSLAEAVVHEKELLPKEDLSPYQRVGQEVGNLVTEKNKAYGDSITASAKYLRLLFPDGVQPDRYKDLGLLIRDFDKSMRIANDKGAFGESPWRDKAGYAVLGVEGDERQQWKRQAYMSAYGSVAAEKIETPISGRRIEMSSDRVKFVAVCNDCGGDFETPVDEKWVLCPKCQRARGNKPEKVGWPTQRYEIYSINSQGSVFEYTKRPILADSFRTACNAKAATDKDFAKHYDPLKTTYNGQLLFPSKEAALAQAERLKEEE